MARLGRYTLIRQIGRGGMAEIWKAKATGPSGFVKHVAIKMILADLADDRTFVSMFVEEAKLAANLAHPNLVTVFDFGEIDKQLFLAMEYVAGANLHRLCSRIDKEDGTLPAELALYIALEACRGLGRAHAAGVVHRDVSPQNVLVSSTGDVKVSDFGIAKAASAITRTAAGQVRGKLAYMSPEQLENTPLDGRTDLFALGIVRFEMLTGAPVFDGRSCEEVSDRVRRFDPTADLDMAKLPAELRPILVKLLQPDRDNRYRDAAALEAALGAHHGLPGVPRARNELAALVSRLVRDELAADARDDEDEPQPREAVTRAVTDPAVETKIEVPTGSKGRRGPTPASLPRTPPAVGEVSAPRPRPRRWLAIAASAAVLVAALGTAWRLLARRTGDGPHRGGVLRLANGFPAQSFDLFSHEQSSTRMTMGQVIEPLLSGNSDGDIVPWTLDRTELSHDGRRIDLHVRPGVTFHNHPCVPGGRPATAEDVAYSIRESLRANELSLPIRGTAEFRAGAKSLAGLVVADASDVTLELTDPAPFYEAELSNVLLVPHELDGCEDLRRMKQPVGTGPYRFTAPPRGARLQLVRAPDYWGRSDDGAQLPYLDGIEVVPIDQLRDTLSRMIHGEIDVALPRDEDWPALVDLAPDRPVGRPPDDTAPIDVAAGTTNNLIALLELVAGPHDGPFHDAAVRRALARVVDRKALVALTPPERPLAGPSGRFLDTRMLGYDPQLAALDTDVEAARAILADAGHPGGAGLAPITIGTVRYAAIAGGIAEQAKAIGLDVRVATLPAASGNDRLQRGEIDALLVIDNWPMMQGENANLVDECDRYKLSAELDALNVALAASPERSDRAPIYTKMERVLLRDLPVVPLAWGDIHRPMQINVIRRDVRDLYDPITMTMRADFRKAWLDR